jgi:hypothetical protein
MEAKEEKRQSNQYDKIFKENIEAVISSIMQNVLEIMAVTMEELPDDIQHTKERKPDVLKKVTDNRENTFVLQIEFQVANDDEMVYRMHEYKAMLIRKYRLPIYQYVIFLGKGQPKMETHLTDVGLAFEYNLLAINSIDYKIFLKSNRPEEIVLSVLANFDKETPENALKRIISRLEETTGGDLSLKRYFKQLRILAQLRKLEQKLKIIVMDSIAKYIDEEKDVAYLVGREKEQLKFVANLLTESDFTIDKIARIAGVAVNFVKSVQKQLTGK